MGKLTFSLLASALGVIGLAACSSFTEASPAVPADGGGTTDVSAADAEISEDGPPISTRSYAALILKDAPLHYFRFGEVSPDAVAVDNGTGADLVAATYRGAVSGGPSALLLDVSDRSLEITGSGCVMASGDSGLDVPSGTFSLEAWISPMAAGVAGVIVSDNDAGSASPTGYVLELLTTGSVQMTLYSPGPQNPLVMTSTKKVAAGTWEHVVFVAHPSELDLYLDGVIDTTMPVQVPTWTNAKRLAIGANNGCDPSDPVGEFFTKGMIDEVALYKNALSADQIFDHFAVGNEGRVSP